MLLPPPQDIDHFLMQQHLDAEYGNYFSGFLKTLAEKLLTVKHSETDQNAPLTVGISGSQGSGKSTLAAALQLILTHNTYRCITISIDDIYLNRAERLALAETIHPLFRTRGVPGTHDTALGLRILQQLKQLKSGEQIKLLRFDKSVDDRATETEWETVEGPIDFILFEGWCVAARAQPEHALQEAVNRIEATEDPELIWRRYINQRLQTDYAELFSQIDYLIFLKIPRFAKVLEWRHQQELELIKKTGRPGMSKEEVERFILLDQRITQHNLEQLPQQADALLTLDEDHRISSLKIKNSAALSDKG
jgi:D-glycerate 3-kinase